MAEKKFFVSHDELQAAYTSLGSSIKVAEHYGVSKKLVLNYFKKYGIKTNQRATPDERAEQIKVLALEGLDSKQISQRLNLNLVMVNRYIRKNDIEVKRFHKGFTIDHAGYVLIKKPDHPNASKNGYVRQHILFMTAAIGRALEKDECVHHIDGNKANNALDNLKLMNHREHKSLHSKQPRKRNVKTQIDDIV